MSDSFLISSLFALCNTTSARRGWAIVDGRRMWTDGVARRLDDGTVACWYEDEPYGVDVLEQNCYLTPFDIVL